LAVFARRIVSLALLRVKFDHDGSQLLVMLLREIPQLLDEWRRRAAPREPLRLQYMWPMQVLDATAEQRYFAVFNVAGSSVALAPMHGDDAAVAAMRGRDRVARPRKAVVAPHSAERRSLQHAGAETASVGR